MAERADLVPLGLVRLRPGCLPAVPAVARRCSIRSIASRCTAAAGRPCSSRSCLPSPPRSTFPGWSIYGPGSWFEFGPFSVQHGRVMLYATYFFFGAGIGVAQMDRGLLARRRPDGEGAAGTGWCWRSFPYCLLWVLIFIKREILGNPSPLPNWYEALYAFCFAVFSVAIMFLILAYFQRFRQSGSAKLLDPMQARRLRHVPGALPDRAVAAILAVRLRPARDRQGRDRVRADGRIELGADAQRCGKIPGATKVL